MHWRRKWQPTPVFLPGESQRWGSLVGCRLWGRTESNTTEATWQQQQQQQQQQQCFLCLTMREPSLRDSACLIVRGERVLINGTGKNDYYLPTLQYTWIQNFQQPEYSISALAGGFFTSWAMRVKESESEVAQSCPTLCGNPMDTRLLCPWDFLGKSTGVGCHREGSPLYF